MKIWTDDECIEVDHNDVGQLEAAMLFKAEHIKAKADQELFAAVAYMLFRLLDSLTKRVDVVRCRECKHMEKYNNARWCKVWRGYNGMGDDGFCNYGERRADNG